LKGKQDLESVSHDVASQDVRPKDPLGTAKLKMRMIGAILKKIVEATINPPTKHPAAIVLSSAIHDKAAEELTSTLVRTIEVKDGQIELLQNSLTVSNNLYSQSKENTRIFRLLACRQHTRIMDQAPAFGEVQQRLRQHIAPDRFLTSCWCGFCWKSESASGTAFTFGADTSTWTCDSAATRASTSTCI
jgi:hypothetical protein